MGKEFWEVLCDEHGIGVDGECCGDNDAQLGRINVLYYEASGGMYVPRAVFFDLEPGVIDGVRESPLGNFFRLGNLVNDTRGQNWAKGHYRRAGTNSSDPPLQRVEYQFPPPLPPPFPAL
jgi:tubulin beta